MTRARLRGALLALVLIASAFAAAADSAAPTSSSSAQATQTSKPAPPAAAPPAGGGLASLLTDVAACLLGVGGIVLAWVALRNADSANRIVNSVHNSLSQRIAKLQAAQSEQKSPKACAASGGESAALGSDLADRVAAVERAIAELREGLVDRAKGLAPLDDELFSPPAAEPPPVFPATVDDLRERFGPGTKVTLKTVTGLLHEDPTGVDSIVRIDGNTVFLPGRGRMASAADYRTYFEQFFSCSSPSRGTVEITLPAIVESCGDGRFKLIHPGEIRIQ